MRRVTITKKRADRRVTINGPVIIPPSLLQQEDGAVLGAGSPLSRARSPLKRCPPISRTPTTPVAAGNTPSLRGGQNSALAFANTPGNRHSVALPLTSTGGGVGRKALPKVRRISGGLNLSSDALSRSSNNSAFFNGGVPYSPRTLHSPNRYVSDVDGSPPRVLHQPQYAGVLPSVKLTSPRRRPVIGADADTGRRRTGGLVRRSASLRVPSTDMMRPAPPLLLRTPVAPSSSTSLIERQLSAPCQQRTPGTAPAPAPSTADPCSTDTVLSALREKRKRPLRDEVVAVETTEDEEASSKKRRPEAPVAAENQTNGHQASEEEAVSRGNKRPASSSPHSTRHEEEGKVERDLQQASKRSRPADQDAGGGSGRKAKKRGASNPLEAAFSSSRRWFAKQLALRRSSRSASSNRSLGSGSASTGPALTTGVTALPTGRAVEEEEAEEEEEELGGGRESESTPQAGLSGRSTPSLPSSAGGLDPPSIKMAAKLALLKKESTSRKRLTPRQASPGDFAAVPRLRYEVTSADYERDRQAQVARVRAMLAEVEDDRRAGAAGNVASKPPLPRSLPVPATTTVPSVNSALTQLLSDAKTAPVQATSDKFTTATPAPKLAMADTVLLSAGANAEGTKNPLLVTASSLGSSSSSTTTTTSGATTTASATQVSAATTVTLASFKPTSLAVPTAAAAGAVLGSTTAPASAGFSFGAKSESVASNSSTESAGFSVAATTSSVHPVAGTVSFGSSAGLNKLSPAANPLLATAKSSTAAAFNFGSTDTKTSSATKPSGGGFSFGSTTIATTTSTPAFSFGVPKVSSSSVGSGSTGTFGTSLAATSAPSSATFGNAAPDVLGQKAAGFSATFGTTTPAATTTTNSSIFGALSKTTTAATATPTPGFNFGGTSSSLGGASGAAAFAIGGAATTTTSSSIFGASAITTTSTAAPSLFSFGATNTAPTSAAGTGFAFGAAVSATPTTTAGTGALTSSKTAPADLFKFGASNSSGTPTFGAAATTTTAGAAPFTFGAAASTTAPAGGGFGAATSAPFQFGANTQTGTSTGSTGAAFQFGAASGASKPAPAPTGAFQFGGGANTGNASSSSSSSGFAFGGSGGSTAPSNPFSGFSGQSGADKQPAAGGAGGVFGSSQPATGGGFSGASFGGTGTSAFGAGGGTPAFGSTMSSPPAFGAPSTPAKGFDFSASAAPSGGATAGGGFNFGAAAANPAPGGGFGGSAVPAFGGGAPSTPQNTGMFSIGATNTAPKPRRTQQAVRRSRRK